MQWSMETGCGKSTILLSNLSTVMSCLPTRQESLQRQHRLLREVPHSSRDHDLGVGRNQAHPAPVQFRTDRFALLDGPHGYPFPELEYYYVYPHLRAGAVLVVDDIHIPTVFRLYSFLVEDEMFELLHVERTTAFFRRTDAPTFSPLGDGWELQAYNRRRFPIDAATADPERSNRADSLQELAQTRAELAALQAELAAQRAELAWWKHAANERRLKRRLARRLGDWPFLK